MNEQKISFLHKLRNSPLIHYCKLVYHTHGIPFVQNILFFLLITIGICLLSIFMYNVTPESVSVFISVTLVPLALFVLTIMTMGNTSTVFCYLHNKRNIFLFHTLPVNQTTKFFVLCFFVYVVQSIIIFLTFVLVAFIVNYLYSFVSPIISLSQFTDQLRDLLEINGVINYFTLITFFFFGAIFFKSRHMVKTTIAIIVGSLLLALLLSMNISIVEILFFHDSHIGDIIVSNIVLAIIVHGVGIPLAYVCMKRHSIAKVK